MVALALVGIAFMVLLQTEGLNTQRTIHGKMLSGAVMLAQEKMEDIFAAGLPDLLDQEEEVELYSVTTSVSATEFPGVDQVRITVNWYEGSREEAYSVIAYLPQ
jgi:hypothetical protein